VARAEAAVTVVGSLAQVHARIERAARSAGRDPATVKLVAVSKTRSPDQVREAIAAGQLVFGENYAQELAAKAEALHDVPGLEWHFVGHLQANKAKVVAKHAHAIHTVDSGAVARELGKRVAREGRRLPVLIEVNVGREPQKAGALASDLDEVIDAVRSQDALVLRGLMTMPPALDLEAAKACFQTLVFLRDLHGGEAALPELSMGMSDDLEVAVECGATMVRVGTAIFGSRRGST
jgi:pyridoxal phosphate enzyme (YggS family)